LTPDDGGITQASGTPEWEAALPMLDAGRVAAGSRSVAAKPLTCRQETRCRRRGMR